MTFRGWPSEALEFYEGLSADNSKSYWTAHLPVYENQVRAPMEELLARLEPEFGPGKIFRPYRDVRFSRDKSPYKEHLAASLPEAGYIQLSQDGLAVGSGMYHLEPDQLARYRAAVASDATGTVLVGIIAKIEKAGIGVRGRDTLKTVPRGHEKDHPRIDLLRHKGLVCWREWPPAAWLGTAAAADRVVSVLKTARPLREWFSDHVG